MFFLFSEISETYEYAKLLPWDWDLSPWLWRLLMLWHWQTAQKGLLFQTSALRYETVSLNPAAVLCTALIFKTTLCVLFSQFPTLIVLLCVSLPMQITGSFLCEKRHSGISHLPGTFLVLLNFVSKALCSRKVYEKLFFPFLFIYRKVYKAYFLPMHFFLAIFFIDPHISVEDIEMKCWVSWSYYREQESFLVILCCISHWRTELL